MPPRLCLEESSRLRNILRQIDIRQPTLYGDQYKMIPMSLHNRARTRIPCERLQLPPIGVSEENGMTGSIRLVRVDRSHDRVGRVQARDQGFDYLSAQPGHVP